jgi:hypothetical protein
MVALNGDRSSNTSSRYPTNGRSKASDARTPSGGLARNLNPDFNAIWVQEIMETIQRMVSDGSPLVVLAQQGAEAATLSSPRSRSVFPRENLLSAATIGQGMPEVKLRHQQVQIIVCPSVTRSGVSLRAVLPENTVVNEMTSAMLLKTRGVSGAELHPHCDGL